MYIYFFFISFGNFFFFVDNEGNGNKSMIRNKVKRKIIIKLKY